LRLSLFLDVTQRWSVFSDVSGRPLCPMLQGRADQQEGGEEVDATLYRWWCII